MFRVTVPLRGYGINFDAPVSNSLDVWSLLLAVGAAVAIFLFKIGIIPTLALACVTGVALHALGLGSASPL